MTVPGIPSTWADALRQLATELLCALLGHRYKFVCITLERDRYFQCRRCGKGFCRG